MMPGARDPWQIATLVLVGLMLLPILLFVWVAMTAVKIALVPLRGWRMHSGGGRSLMDEVLAFNVLHRVFRTPDPIPCYHLVLNTPLGMTVARQEGEFVAGQPIVGHDVEFWGSVRDGYVIVAGGRDNTVGTDFRVRRSAHRYYFVFALVVLLCGLALLLASGR